MRFLAKLLTPIVTLFGFFFAGRSSGKEKEKRKSVEKALENTKDAHETRSNYRKSSKSKRKRVRDKYSRD